jgi:hypothetical protein
MSCWVVPAIAADLWGVPVQQILGRIEAGSVPSKFDHGFVLVDVAPHGDTFRPLPRPRVGRRVPTFTVISDVELEALNADVSADECVNPAPWSVPFVVASDDASPAEFAATPDAPTFSEPEPVQSNSSEVKGPVLSLSNGPVVSERSESNEPVPCACAGSQGSESSHDEEMGPAGDPDPEVDVVEPETGPPLHWKIVRARVASIRKPPGSR